MGIDDFNWIALVAAILYIMVSLGALLSASMHAKFGRWRDCAADFVAWLIATSVFAAVVIAARLYLN